jgi:tryptophan synthase alpha chain
VMQYGVRDFFASCRMAGVDGVIIPDLPIEEARDVIKLGRQAAVATIFLIAPTSARKRISDIAGRSSGFVYYVSLTGVTGARTRLPSEIKARVRLIKSMTNKPVAVGFGVSGPAQARDIARVADGVIVGSAIVRIIGEKRNTLPRLAAFAKKIADAVHNG